MIRLFLVLSLACTLGSCASRSTVVAKPDIKSIALIPATTPKSYSVDGRSFTEKAFFPASVLFADRTRGDKGQLFTQQMPISSFRPGEQFTATVAQGLRDLGYLVDLLDNLPRDPEDPDDVDVKKLSHTADAVLHLYFRDIGVHSRPAGRNYVPRLVVGGRMMAKGTLKDIYYNIMYYGYDADPTDTWTSVVADAKYRYEEFGDVLKNLDPLRGAFLGAVQTISNRMTTQIHGVIK